MVCNSSNVVIQAKCELPILCLELLRVITELKWTTEEVLILQYYNTYCIYTQLLPMNYQTY